MAKSDIIGSSIFCSLIGLLFIILSSVTINSWDYVRILPKGECRMTHMSYCKYHSGSLVINDVEYQSIDCTGKTIGDKILINIHHPPPPAYAGTLNEVGADTICYEYDIFPCYLDTHKEIAYLNPVKHIGGWFVMLAIGILFTILGMREIYLLITYKEEGEQNTN